MSTHLAQELRKAFEAVADPGRAPAMAAYMKQIAPFMGVTSQNRKLAQKE